MVDPLSIDFRVEQKLDTLSKLKKL